MRYVTLILMMSIIGITLFAILINIKLHVEWLDIPFAGLMSVLSVYAGYEMTFDWPE